MKKKKFDINLPIFRKSKSLYDHLIQVNQEIIDKIQIFTEMRRLNKQV